MLHVYSLACTFYCHLETITVTFDAIVKYIQICWTWMHLTDDFDSFDEKSESM